MLNKILLDITVIVLVSITILTSPNNSHPEYPWYGMWNIMVPIFYVLAIGSVIRHGWWYYKERKKNG